MSSTVIIVVLFFASLGRGTLQKHLAVDKPDARLCERRLNDILDESPVVRELQKFAEIVYGEKYYASDVRHGFYSVFSSFL